MLGKLIGKEDEVQKWEKDWKAQTAKDGKEIKEKLAKIKQYQLLTSLTKSYTHMVTIGAVAAKYYIKLSV